MNFGLADHIIKNINRLFEQYPNVDKAILFGSRAKGNYRPDSDIDIAIKSDDLTLKEIAKITDQLEDITSKKVDLFNYYTIKEPELTAHIDRVGIEFYSKWKDYKVGDIVNLEYGKSLTDYRSDNGKYDVFGTNGKIGTTDEFLYDKPSLIIGRKGAYRETHLSKKPFFVIDTAFYTKNKLDGLDTSFLYYWFKNTNINDMDSGSAIPSTSRDEVYELDIKLPPLSDQTAIASILSCLDDKIDLLHRQNKTLEQLAQTLFKQWFVEEAEKSWDDKPFGMLIETTLGGEWGKEISRGEFNKQVCCIRGTDIADLQNGLALKAPIRFVKESKFKNIEPKNGDLILEISGGTDDQSTGRTIYISDSNRSLFPFPLVFSNFCRLVRPKQLEFSYFLYLYLQYLYMQDEFFNLENGSSGIKNLDYKVLLFELKYKLPKETEVIIKFNQKVELYFERINKNKHQMKTLSSLRDSLLPKLITGEVRVDLSPR